jgi:hypothetical protein
MTERTVVAIGCSTTKDYAFLLPLTCLLWRHVGYLPLALLVGTEAEWRKDSQLSIILDALYHSDLAVEFLGRIDGYQEHTLAQNCRQHAAALESVTLKRFSDNWRVELFLMDDTWIMPADADLWPLRREYYHQHEGTQHKAVFYYANGDHFQGKDITLARAGQGLGTQTIPSCHVAMRAKDWRVLYDVIAGDVAGSVKKSLDAWLPSRAVYQGRDLNMTLWMSDQQLMTEALCQQNWFPFGAPPSGMGPQVAGALLFVNRYGHPPTDRLDRSVTPWPEIFDATKWTDAHVFRQPWIEEHWRELHKIVKALLPEQDNWALAYRDAYLGAA